MIEAIFFDWDGTLMDDDASWRRCVAATAAAVAERYAHVDAAELTAAYHAAADQVWNELRGVRAAVGEHG